MIGRMSGDTVLIQDNFFISEDDTLLNAARVLHEFGFPWDRLGILYVESGCFFKCGASELKGRLCGFKRYGFCNAQVVGICLAFPFVFDGQKGDEVEALFCDLGLLFGELGLAECVEGKGNNSVDDWIGVCRKIRLFYDLNGGRSLVELVGGNNGVGVGVILEHGEEELVQASEYFCRFGAESESESDIDCMSGGGVYRFMLLVWFYMCDNIIMAMIILVVSFYFYGIDMK